MATCTWTQQQNQDWGDHRNWSGGVPGPSDEAVLPADPTLASPIGIPVGARVRALRMEGLSLGERITVSERLDWSGGVLQKGLDLGASATVGVTGTAAKSLRGPLRTGDLTLDGAAVELGDGARITVAGLLRATGHTVLAWGGGAPPSLVHSGVLVVDGTLLLSGVPLRSDGTVQPLQGGELRIEESDTASVLDASAVVTGAGTLTVGTRGRLVPAAGARVSAGGTLTVDGGAVLAAAPGGLTWPTPPPTAGRLGVFGTLRWGAGGLLGAPTVVYAGGLLGAAPAPTGPARRLEADLRVRGAAEWGAGTYSPRTCTVTVESGGELRLTGAVEVESGPLAELVNRGVLRCVSGSITLGDNVIRNDGTLLVGQASVVVGEIDATYVQGPSGVLRLDAGAELRVAGSPLDLAEGELRGAGRVRATVNLAAATITATDPATPLMVDGDLLVGPGATLAVDVGAGGTPRVAVTGVATLRGTVAVTGSSGAGAVGQTHVAVTAARVDGDPRPTGVDLGQHVLDLDRTDPTRLRLVVAERSMIWVFHGHSGDLTTPIPPFPDGTDHDLSLATSAATLRTTLQSLYPADVVEVRQTWQQQRLLDALRQSPLPVRQVHIVSHGSPVGLSLAYRYDGYARIQARAVRFNAMAGSDVARAGAAAREEDALLACLFGAGLLPQAEVDAVRDRLAPHSEWHVWGCRTGSDLSAFSGAAPTPAISQYQLRFNALDPTLSQAGLARQLALTFGVTCTAATGPPDTGLQFWHGTAPGATVANTGTTPPTAPFWMWSTPGSSWVTWSAIGHPASAGIQMLGRPRDPADLPVGRPPDWFTDLYWLAVGPP